MSLTSRHPTATYCVRDMWYVWAVTPWHHPSPSSSPNSLPPPPPPQLLPSPSPVLPHKCYPSHPFRVITQPPPPPKFYPSPSTYPPPLPGLPLATQKDCPPSSFPPSHILQGIAPKLPPSPPMSSLPSLPSPPPSPFSKFYLASLLVC